MYVQVPITVCNLLASQFGGLLYFQHFSHGSHPDVSSVCPGCSLLTGFAELLGLHTFGCCPPSQNVAPSQDVACLGTDGSRCTAKQRGQQAKEAPAQGDE